MAAPSTPLPGLRTAIYPAPDLAATKSWFTTLLGIEPYFDADFYVGYQIAGYELALDPNADPSRGVITYWGVADVDVALAHLLGSGAVVDRPVEAVGDGIRTATVFVVEGGGLLGVIENPHFQAETPTSDGPGR